AGPALPQREGERVLLARIVHVSIILLADDLEHRGAGELRELTEGWRRRHAKEDATALDLVRRLERDQSLDQLEDGRDDRRGADEVVRRGDVQGRHVVLV